MEVADDRRERGRDDRLVQCSEEHAEQQRAHDHEHPAPRQVERRAELRCRRAHRGTAPFRVSVMDSVA